ncbi:MAG: hypothetical protein WBV55_23695 [Candidatus Sulfotelmatobacter sp.]
MTKNIVKSIRLRVFALFVMLGAAWQAQAQSAKAPYPNMAPLEKYLIADRNAEIALARTAAPESISQDANVLVLGRHGYETAVKGKNGFVCLVERSWMSGFDSPEFWNPRLRGPVCFNPPAARTVLPLTFKRTGLVLEGLSKAQIIDGIKTFDKNELPPLEAGGMAYMLSKEGYLADDGGHWVPHLMLYAPLTSGNTWGADLAGSPILLSPQFHGAPEPISVFLIPVLNWSDGTAAPKDAH